MKKIKLLSVAVLALLLCIGLAACAPILRFKIGFMVDGERYATVQTDGKTAITLPADPTKEGYTFGGWYWDEGVWEKPFTANSILDTPLSSDMLVYARWVSAAHEHTPSDWQIEKAATCKETGLKYKTCETCGERVAEEAIPVLTEHTPSDWKIEKAATCKASGLKYKTCETCGDRVAAEAIPILTEHTPSDWKVEKAATCKAAGLKYKTCETCGDRVAEEAIPLLTEHTPSDWKVEKAATCKETGLKYKTCESCGDRVAEEEIPLLLAHYPSQWQTERESTCAVAGVRYRTCTVCSKRVSEEALPLAAHTPAADWTVEREPTLTAEGLRYKACTACGAHALEEAIPSGVVEYLTYTINPDGETCTLTGIGNYSAEELIIPETLGGYRVTVIANAAIKEKSDLTEGKHYVITRLVIPDTVTTIEARAIRCPSLLHLTVGAGVQSIGDYALTDMNPKAVEIYNRSGLAITAGDTGFGRIAVRALRVYGPEEQSRLEKIGDFHFYHEGSAAYLVGYSGTAKDLILPLDYKGGSYAIHRYALKYEPIESLIVPSKVTTIGSDAFNGCNVLHTVAIQNGVTAIGSWAFATCSELVSVTIPSSVTSIGSNAFISCLKLQYTEYGFGKYLGSGSNPYHAFMEPKPGYTDDPEFHKDTVVIAAMAFYQSSKLTTVNLTVPHIGDSAFSACANLKTVAITEGAGQTIESRAFFSCTSLEKLTIEGTQTVRIGDSAFSGCKKLYQLTIEAPTEVGRSAFQNCTALQHTIGGESMITRIGEYAFCGCSDLNFLRSDVLQSVGAYAFENCFDLWSFEAGAQLTEVSAYAFEKSGLHYAVFGSTDGWWFTTDPNATSGTSVGEGTMADEEDLGAMIKLHPDWYWRRTT